MKTIQIENRIGRVRLNDVVNPISADELIGDIERLYGAKAVEENMVVAGFEAKDEESLEVLELDIHTPGGSVLDGYRIYNSLKEMQARGVRVKATINTLAASMGSVIMMAADEIGIVKGGRIMIHDANQSVSGNAADHERAAKNLNEISEEISVIYAERTGKDPEEMRELMRAETWMGAKEAVERGFVDYIADPSKKSRVETASMETEEPDTPNFMTIFKSNKDWQAKVEDLSGLVNQLEAQATEHESEILNLKNDITNQTEAISALTTERDTIKAELDTATATITEQEATITEANDKLATFDDEVENKVQLKVASLGFKDGVPESSKESSDSEAETKTREEFNAMSPIARMDFVKAGGKLK